MRGDSWEYAFLIKPLMNKIEIDISEYIQLVYDSWKLAVLEEWLVDEIEKYMDWSEWDSYEEVTNIVTSSLQ